MSSSSSSTSSSSSSRRPIMPAGVTSYSASPKPSATSSSPPRKRQRSALFYLGVASAPRHTHQRCFVQVRRCRNGDVLGTELMSVDLTTPLSELVARRNGTDATSTVIYMDASGFHEPWRSLDQLPTIQRFDTTVGEAYDRWHCCRFVIDVTDSFLPPKSSSKPPASSKTWPFRPKSTISQSVSPEPSSKDTDVAKVTDDDDGGWEPIIKIEHDQRQPKKTIRHTHKPTDKVKNDAATTIGNDNRKATTLGSSWSSDDDDDRRLRQPFPTKKPRRATMTFGKKETTTERPRRSSTSALARDGQSNNVVGLSSSVEGAAQRGPGQPKSIGKKAEGAPSRTLVVSMEGHDDYHTICDAAKMARSGDEIVLKKGLYRTDVIDLSDNITLRAADGLGRDDVRVQSRLISVPVVRILGSNVTLKNISFCKSYSKKSKGYPSVVDIDGNLHDISILDCRIDGGVPTSTPFQTGARYHGCFFDVRTTGRIERTVIENIPFHGVASNPDGVIQLRACQLRDVQGAGVWVARRCPGLSDVAVRLQATSFEGCRQDVDAGDERRISYEP